jgi:hypothetical protein
MVFLSFSKQMPGYLDRPLPPLLKSLPPYHSFTFPISNLISKKPVWIKAWKGSCVCDLDLFSTEIRGSLQVKGKVKLSLCLTKHHTMKTYRRSGCIAPCNLDLGTRWRWVVSFTPRPLYPQGKSPWYPLDGRLGGPQSRSRYGDEEKNSQSPPRIEP